jgi:HSP20 family protein
MTLISVKPVTKKLPLVTDLDRLFEEFFNAGLNGNYRNGKFLNNVPAVNVIETGEHFLLEVAAPGLDKSDFNLHIDKEVLTISANREINRNESEVIRRKEFGFLNFERVFRLPVTIDTSAIEANYQNGILRLTLPKKEEAKVKPPRKIEIA